MSRLLLSIFLTLILAVPAWAGLLDGRVADRSGAVLAGATVRITNVATGETVTATTDAGGRFAFADLPVGIYRVTAVFPGFSESSQTVVVQTADQQRTADFALELGSIRSEVTVAADRGARDVQLVPLRADTISADQVYELGPVSTGDALLAAPGVTPVGSGPFQVRPRLRGLDSTRVLVLVDGERLNNARTATDRAGVDVGLIDPSSIESLEVLGGAGSVLYGTDALSGTINIITNRARFSDVARLSAGFDGLYSSNEDGRRGTVTLGVSTRRVGVSFVGGAERFDEYRAGGNFTETSQPFYDEGRLTQADTVDDAFGFSFGAFPDPFNAPYTRNSATIGNSGMRGNSANLSAITRLAANQTLEFKYQRRNAEDVGFPDFVKPFFFQGISLPWSRLNKASAIWTATNLTPWLSRVSATAYVQKQDRLLRNDFTVQFPAPTAVTFFPINVFALNILSDTRQQVSTPGVDVQATFLTHPNNVLTAGVTMFRDHSEDERETSTRMTQIGRVAIGQRGPAATVFPEPIALGPPTIDNPVRVPEATFRNAAVFVHNEWSVSPELRVTGGFRVDGYRVVAENTPGYSIDSIIADAVPAIDPSTLPNAGGDEISRTAFTGEAGAVVRPDRPVSYFAHYVRSYRHPNLEELLFSGPATTGNIVPNLTVNPETGHNVDVGTRFRFPRLAGTFSYFNNTYRDFISTEVVARLPTDSISQAVNLARVRIQGVEAEAAAPFVTGDLSWLPQGGLSYNRGTVLEGVTPIDGTSLNGAPQDNITPWKVTGGVRVGDLRERWWASYSVRSQAEVTRVSPLLADSVFLIAQDIFGLQGFSVHRIAVGYDWRSGNQRVGLTLAVDNLTDEYYREHFQFAPARGRSVTLQIRVRGER
jgi:hemoglobin/transferrin/lactoferrin receptor protein